SDLETEKPRLGHAEHGDTPPPDRHRPADDRQVAAELTLPEGVADDGGRGAAAYVVRLRDQPPRRGPDAEDAKVRAAHPQTAVCDARPSAVGHIERRGRPGEGVERRSTADANALPQRVGQ